MDEGYIQKTYNSSVESLRLILEREQSRTVTYEEATLVSESLVSFYELLVAKEEPKYE